MARKFNETELKELAKSKQGVFESSSQILKSFASKFDSNKQYDVFISHSFNDAEVVHGLKILIETNYSLSVYVDWIDDPELDRTQVSRKTADRLRLRMKNCKVMLVAHSESSPDSKWVPWEIGYFDAHSSRIAILPISSLYTYSEKFEGQEYLGLYSYGVQQNNENGTTIFIQDTPTKYVSFSHWVAGKEPYERGA